MPEFFKSLVTLAEVCREELTEVQLLAYWTVCAPRLTLQEWQQACLEALAQETRAQVPMPAALLAYARAARQAQQEAERAAWEAQRQRAQPQGSRDDRRNQEEVRRLLASVFPEERRNPLLEGATQVHEDGEGRRRYESGRTPGEEAARKALLRAQAEQIRREAGRDGNEEGPR
jgi:hypothetical protein